MDNLKDTELICGQRVETSRYGVKNMISFDCSDKTGSAGHTECMGRVGDARKTLVGKPRTEENFLNI